MFVPFDPPVTVLGGNLLDRAPFEGRLMRPSVWPEPQSEEPLLLRHHRSAVHIPYDNAYDHWYATRNSFVCQPGTWFRGEDGRRHLCQ